MPGGPVEHGRLRATASPPDPSLLLAPAPPPQLSAPLAAVEGGEEGRRRRRRPRGREAADDGGGCKGGREHRTLEGRPQAEGRLEGRRRGHEEMVNGNRERKGGGGVEEIWLELTDWY